MSKARKIISGYNVYHAPDGSSPSYYGFAETLDEAKALAAKGRSLEASLWDTARAAGHCAGLGAPDQSNEDSEPTEWFGEDGYDCAVAVLVDEPEPERRKVSISGNWRKGGPDREWAGTGTVDKHGAIECSANLDGDAYELIEEQIAAGDTEGSVTVEAEDGREVTYHWSME